MAWFSRSRELQELRGRVEALERWVSQLHGTLEATTKRVDGSASAVLAANLDDLRAAIDVDRAALRKQLGKIWGTIGASRDAAPTDAGGGDDELSRWLDLQSKA